MQSIWYALLLGLYLTEPGSASGGLRADVFINSLPMGSIRIEGDSVSGQIHSGELLLGSYEASRQYRQTYLVFPSEDAEQFLNAPETMALDGSQPDSDPGDQDSASPANQLGRALSSLSGEAGSSARDDAGLPRYASSAQPPMALDLTPVLAGLPRLVEGRILGLPPGGYPEPMPQDWTLRLDRGRLSISSATAGIVVIVY